jgi:sulfur carrier protein
MIITINGKPEEIKLQSNLTGLILSKGLSVDNLVIEYNSRIVPKREWKDIVLEENDTVEIVSFVGGG